MARLSEAETRELRHLMRWARPQLSYLHDSVSQLRTRCQGRRDPRLDEAAAELGRILELVDKQLGAP